jgi:sialidase-1
MKCCLLASVALACLLIGSPAVPIAAAETVDRENSPGNHAIHFVMIEPSGPDVPRADTATVEELSPGHLYVVYHRYRSGRLGGSDFGRASIWAQESHDDGQTWTAAREIIPDRKEDFSVMMPAICRLPSGELLLLVNRVHSRSSTSMELYRSKDNGKSWHFDQAIWSRSKGQWLQGGAAQLLRLASGRLIFGMHGGTGDQWSQKNDAWCYVSDDDGRTWRRSKGTIKLPMRGAMEASLAELADGQLVLSLRTQLGGPFISRSTDAGDTWSPAKPSGLVGPESCTCLRRIPGTDLLVLFWNHSEYLRNHHHFGERTPLSAALSRDAGRTWKKLGDIETEKGAGYTNLNCTFTSSGRAIVTYLVSKPAWQRQNVSMSLKSAVIPKAWFLETR